MKRLYIMFLAFSLLTGKNMFSQVEENKLDSVLDAILFEDEDLLKLIYEDAGYQFLYTGLNFNSKSLYAGRSIGLDQFDITGQVHYFHSSGFNIGIAGVAYSEFQPKYNTTILSAGYFHKFKKVPPLSIRASYQRYFFEEVDSVESSSFNSSVNFGTSFTIKHFGSSANISFLIGDEFSKQIDASIWGSFNLLKFGYSNKLVFEPEVSVYFGNQTAIYGQFGTDYASYLAYLLGQQVEIFGLMNTEIAFPLTLSIKNLDLDLGYYLNLPRALGDEPKIDPVGYWGIGISFLFDLGKK